MSMDPFSPSSSSLKKRKRSPSRDDCCICLDAIAQSKPMFLPNFITPCCGKGVHAYCVSMCLPGSVCPLCRGDMGPLCAFLTGTRNAVASRLQSEQVQADYIEAKRLPPPTIFATLEMDTLPVQTKRVISAVVSIVAPSHSGLSAEEEPRDIVLVVDISASMHPNQDDLKTALKFIVSQLRANDRLSVVTLLGPPQSQLR